MNTRQRRVWSAVQALMFVAAVALVATLLLAEELGLDIFWNALIPAAPALLVIAPGLWRNVCPMATTSLLPRTLGISRSRALSPELRQRLTAMAIVGLVLLVPARHLWLNLSGAATATMLVGAAIVAFGMGATFQYRSGWCATLCPIHPVEKLYGARPVVAPANARCSSCARCVAPCADSTPRFTPIVAPRRGVERLMGHALVGGFVGFVWGWYQVPDARAAVGLAEVGVAYAWPIGASAMTLVAYAGLRRLIAETHHDTLLRLFAAAAIVTYYWFRLPALVGLGTYPGDGMLVDLSASLPAEAVAVVRFAVTSLFFWLLVVRRERANGWSPRPAFAPRPARA